MSARLSPGTPCKRCRRPMTRSFSGYCVRCGSGVRCPCCHVALGRSGACPPCKAALVSIQAAHNPTRGRAIHTAALDADPERQARIARYTDLAGAGRPLFPVVRPHERPHLGLDSRRARRLSTEVCP